MSTVLLVGEDRALLETRAALLRTTGAETLCSGSATALAVQASREFDLIVLCHTLSSQSCLAITAATQARWPQTRILQITPARFWDHSPTISVDAVTSADPERLIDRTNELLARHN
jgi:hypothetical protein